jgi:pimeloyl-ACP methyl ester carboxylesterase
MKETFKKVINQDLKIGLEKIMAPTLILWGDKDDMVPEKHAHILKEKIKNSRLIIFPGVKHALNTQIPEKLAEEILKFLTPNA